MFISDILKKGSRPFLLNMSISQTFNNHFPDISVRSLSPGSFAILQAMGAAPRCWCQCISSWIPEKKWWIEKIWDSLSKFTIFQKYIFQKMVKKWWIQFNPTKASQCQHSAFCLIVWLVKLKLPRSADGFRKACLKNWPASCDGRKTQCSVRLPGWWTACLGPPQV